MTRFFGKVASLALVCGFALAATASATPAWNVTELFGTRVLANPQFPSPFLTGDFDGDGKQDVAFLVTIKPISAQARNAKDVTVVDSVFGRQPLGTRGEKTALAIVQDAGAKKVLLTGYLGDGVADYFDSPIWSGKPTPLSVARRGSKQMRHFQKLHSAIKNDVIVIGTEAGIDTALYWNGRSYALFAPAEEP